MNKRAVSPIIVAVLSFVTVVSMAEDKPTLIPPEGYVVQTLDPLGGKVVRPKEWEYRKIQSGTTWAYQIFKPGEAKDGPFETGLTINVVMNVKKLSGKTPSEYAEVFFEKKLLAAKEVLREKPREQGGFVRKGLLIDEPAKGSTKKEMRIGYTLFCADAGDFLVVMIFGCPKTEWETHRKTQETMMNQIVLFDLADAQVER